MFLSFAACRKFALVKKTICCLITLTFVMSLPGPASAQMASLLPVPGTAVTISPVYIAPTLKGLNIHPENPFLFDFIVSRGDDKIQGPALKAESEKLVKFFLTAMTIPDTEAWVNLSPYEANRIIPEALGKTEMGKVMLEQDYLLKQLASSLTNPETDLGKKFWTNVRAQVQEQFGTTDIPMSTFNKVWIVPAKAEVAEKDGKVLITQNRLQVMLEEDLEAMQKTLDAGRSTLEKSTSVQSLTSDITALSSQVFRTTILPSIEKEINEGKNFAAVRQIYDAAILAVWYKSALKESLLGKIYADKSKVKGIETDAVGFKQDVYNQYVQAFKKGAYNIIKEDFDMNTAESVPTRYFSGGFTPLPHFVDRRAGVSSSGVNVVKDDALARVQLTQGGPEAVVVATGAAKSAASAVTAGKITRLNSGDELLTAINKGKIGKDTRVGEIKFVVNGAEQVYTFDTSIEAINRKFGTIVFGEASDVEKSIRVELINNGVLDAVSSTEVRLTADLNQENIDMIKKLAGDDAQNIFEILQQSQLNQEVVSIRLTGLSGQEIPIEQVTEIAFVSSSAVTAEIISNYQVRITNKIGESVTVFIPGSRKVQSISPMHVKGVDLFVAILSGQDDYRIMILDQQGQIVPTVGQADEQLIAAVEIALKSIKHHHQQEKLVKHILRDVPHHAIPRGEDNATDVAERIVEHWEKNASASSSLVDVNLEANYPLVYNLGLVIKSEAKRTNDQATPAFQNAVREFINGDDNQLFENALEGTSFSQTADGNQLLDLQSKISASADNPSSKDLSAAEKLFSKNGDVIFDVLQKYVIGLEQARVVRVRKGLDAFEILSQAKGQAISEASWQAIKPLIEGEDDGLLSETRDALRGQSDPAQRQVGVELGDMMTEIFNGRISRIEQEVKDFFFDNRAVIYRTMTIVALSGDSLIVQSFDDWLADYALRKGENLATLQNQLSIEGNKRNVILRAHWARTQNDKIAKGLEFLQADQSVRQELIIAAQGIKNQTKVALVQARAALGDLYGFGESLNSINQNGVLATLQIDVLEFDSRVDELTVRESEGEISGIANIQEQIQDLLNQLIDKNIEDAEDSRVAKINSLLDEGYVLVNSIENTDNDFEALAAEDERINPLNTEGVNASTASSPASLKAVGGINFDPTLMNLQVKRDKNGVPLPVFQQDLPNINIEGLYPVIINIAPVTMANFPLLSKAEEEEQKKAAFKAQLSPADRQKAIREEDILAQKS